MSTLLDRLDAEHPGGDPRRYIANLIVVGGATRAQVAEALSRKYSIPAPSGRSITTWLNQDDRLVAMIRELEDIRRELNPGDDLADVLAKMPDPVDPMEASLAVFDLTERFPGYALLLYRAGHDEGFDGDAAERELDAAKPHDSDEAFEAHCRALAGDYDPHRPHPGAGALA